MNYWEALKYLALCCTFNDNYHQNYFKNNYSKEPWEINTIIFILQVWKLRHTELKCLLKVTQQVHDKMWPKIPTCDSQSHAVPMIPHCLPEKFLKCIFTGDKRLKNTSALRVRTTVRWPVDVYLNLWRNRRNEWKEPWRPFYNCRLQLPRFHRWGL